MINYFTPSGFIYNYLFCHNHFIPSAFFFNPEGMK
jgi:hypothetical protein